MKCLLLNHNYTMTPTPEDLQVQFPDKLRQIEAFQADMLRGCGAPSPFRQNTMTPLTITLKRSHDGSWSFGWQTEHTSKQWRGGFKSRTHAWENCKRDMMGHDAWDCDSCEHTLDDDGTCCHCQKMRDEYPATSEGTY